MTTRPHRSPARLAITLLLLTVFTLAVGRGGSGRAVAQDKTPSKLAGAVQRMLTDLSATGAQRSSLARIAVDPSALSNPLVRVYADGQIELTVGTRTTTIGTGTTTAGPVGRAVMSSPVL